jgi:hypothetical protein
VGHHRKYGYWEWEDDIHAHAVFIEDPDGGGPDTDPNYEEIIDCPRSTDPRHGPPQTNMGSQLYPVYMWDYTGSLSPHTFIETPNMTKGFYPKAEYRFFSAFVTVPGEVRNDSRHPRNGSATYTFYVDAATLSRVEQGMEWSPGLYELNNGFWNHAYNCTGWANQVLAGAGLKAGWGGVGANPWTN